MWANLAKPPPPLFFSRNSLSDELVGAHVPLPQYRNTMIMHFRARWQKHSARVPSYIDGPTKSELLMLSYFTYFVLFFQAKSLTADPEGDATGTPPPP